MRRGTGMNGSSDNLRKDNEMKKRIAMFLAAAMAAMCEQQARENKEAR